MAVFRRRDGRPAPVRPQRSGGRRKPSFLLREECASVQGKKVGGAVAGTRPTGRQTSHPERPPWRLPGTVAKERPTPIGPARDGARTPHAIRPSPEQGDHTTIAASSSVPRCGPPPSGAKQSWPGRPTRVARERGVAPAQPDPAPGYGAKSAMSEAIRASGALNRPRRSSCGTTASTASSFSLGSMRR